ncbi:MAG: 3-methyl-2-oxobutanoate hydroxymethyltransferase [Pseudomonadota bacterium]
MSSDAQTTRYTLTHFQKMREQGEKIVMLTAYDASFAALAESAGVEILLIGDSLGMVIQGHDSTLPVTMADIEYHVRSVTRGAKQAMVVADMPFASYQISPPEAFTNAAKLMAAGAQMVKLEGGRAMLETVRFLVERGIPVCGHLGLTPQSVHQMGGYRVQGKTEESSKQLMEDAKLLQQAGAAMIVLETIPAQLAKEVTEAINIPTIGIGASMECSGQVLVVYDMLDIYPGRKARFVKNFMTGNSSVKAAIESYVREVKAKTFPASEHTFR